LYQKTKRNKTKLMVLHGCSLKILIKIHLYFSLILNQITHSHSLHLLRVLFFLQKYICERLVIVIIILCPKRQPSRQNKRDILILFYYVLSYFFWIIFFSIACLICYILKYLKHKIKYILLHFILSHLLNTN